MWPVTASLWAAPGSTFYVGGGIGGRYVFLEKQGTRLPPNEFDPDFWTATAGLAIKL